MEGCKGLKRVPYVLLFLSYHSVHKLMGFNYSLYPHYQFKATGWQAGQAYPIMQGSD